MIGRVERLGSFERDEANAAGSLALLFELKHAGSWHTARCIPAGRCSCDKTSRTTPPRKAN